MTVTPKPFIASTIPVAIPLLLVLLILYHGLSITPDSNAYIQGALELFHNKKYQYFSGAPITLFPPATSILYATTYVFTHDITTSVFLTNCIALIITYILLYTLFAKSLIKSILAIVIMLPFFTMATSEAVWIPAFIFWLSRVLINRSFYNPLLSLLLISIRYASIIPLNCYYLITAIFFHDSRKKSIRNILIDSTLFITMKHFISDGAGHKIGFGVAKFGFFENLFTAYSSISAAFLSHYFWQLTKPHFIPIIIILFICCALIFKGRKGITNQQWLVITFVNLSIIAQAFLLSITYVWDSNGFRYNFWTTIPLIAILPINTSKNNIIITSVLVISSLLMHNTLTICQDCLHSSDHLSHPYLLENTTATFEMKQYQWEK